MFLNYICLPVKQLNIAANIVVCHWFVHLADWFAERKINLESIWVQKPVVFLWILNFWLINESCYTEPVLYNAALIQCEMSAQ